MFCRRHRNATNERRRQMYTNVVAAAELYVESTLLNKKKVSDYCASSSPGRKQKAGNNLMFNKVKNTFPARLSLKPID